MKLIRSMAACLLAVTLVLAHLAPRTAEATVNSQVNKTIVLGNGAQTQFTFNFIGVAAAYISVIHTDASGNETVLTRGAGATQYQIVLNAPVAGAIWGVGGTVTYNPSGTPIASGSTLTIFRTLPLTQAITLQNQLSIQSLGKGAETGLDTGTMQLQQVSENIARAIVAPISDPVPPAPLPTIAQRANQGAVFDGSGNLVAGAMPGSGVISSAMQPVVNAASLAAGRTAFGLGNIATQNIGSGLQNDGAGNVRVNSPITQVSTNQGVTAAFNLNRYLSTGPINFTFPRANTLYNGFGFWIYNTNAGAITLVIDANDSFQGYSSGQSLNIPPNAAVYISTDAASSGAWLIEWGLSTAPPMATGGFSGLVITNNSGTPNTRIDVTAADITMPGLQGGAVRASSVAFTINCAITGVNGMDNTPLAINTWYAVWAISNGSTTGGLVSASTTAPTLPAGFKYQKRLGMFRTDGSGNFYRILQKGTRAKYVVTPATNTAAPRQITTFSGGGIGSVTTPTYVSQSVVDVVPSTASQLHVQLMVVSGVSSTTVLIAPNGNYGSYNSTTNMPPITSVTDVTSNQSLLHGLLATMLLESNNIYIAANTNTTVTIAAEGWTDNL